MNYYTIVTNSEQDHYKTLTNSEQDHYKSNANQLHGDSDKPRHNAVKRTPKQNKTKQNKTKLTKQNDRSIARARKIENESENEYETFEVDGVINEVKISDGVVKNDTSKNVNGVVNGSKGKTGGVAISDTDKFNTQTTINRSNAILKKNAPPS